MHTRVRSNRHVSALWKRFSWLLPALCAFFVVFEAAAQTTLPVLWTVSNPGASNGVRLAADTEGNVAVVSGNPNLWVTSYTASGVFRWSRVIPLGPGTLVADWVAAAPNNDFVVAGRRVSSHGQSYEAIVARYSNDGTLLWRQDIPTYGGLYGCVVGRLIVDAAGSTYLVGSFVGPNVDATILKFNPTGTLLWSRKDLTIANSVSVSPDGGDVFVTGFIPGSFSQQTAAHDAATGTPKWFVDSAESGGGKDLVVDDNRVYVTGMGVTGAGTPGIAYHLTVIAYNRVTGARLWRTDSRPTAGLAAGLRIALTADNGLVAAGQASASSYLNWWIVAMDRSGRLRWQATRDRAVTGDEIPASLFVLRDGTTVVSGAGGPNIGSSYLQGVVAGYSRTGTPLWEGFAAAPLFWAIPLPNGVVVGTGGSNVLTTAWRPPRSRSLSLQQTQ